MQAVGYTSTDDRPGSEAMTANDTQERSQFQTGWLNIMAVLDDLPQLRERAREAAMHRVLHPDMPRDVADTFSEGIASMLTKLGDVLPNASVEKRHELRDALVRTLAAIGRD